jgi:hypothetical protein
MNLKSIVDKLDQLVERAREELVPTQKDIDRLCKDGLTVEEAHLVWRRSVRGRGWTIDTIQDIDEDVANTLARRNGSS